MTDLVCAALRGLPLPGCWGEPAISAAAMLPSSLSLSWLTAARAAVVAPMRHERSGTTCAAAASLSAGWAHADTTGDGARRGVGCACNDSGSDSDGNRDAAGGWRARRASGSGRAANAASPERVPLHRVLEHRDRKYVLLALDRGGASDAPAPAATAATAATASASCDGGCDDGSGSSIDRIIKVPFFLAALRYLVDYGHVIDGDDSDADTASGPDGGGDGEGDEGTDGRSGCMGWEAGGDAFWVAPRRAAFPGVLATAFRHASLQSFQRQLAAYGFRYRTDDADRMIVRHPHFVRGAMADMVHIDRTRQERTAAVPVLPPPLATATAVTATAATATAATAMHTALHTPMHAAAAAADGAELSTAYRGAKRARLAAADCGDEDVDSAVRAAADDAAGGAGCDHTALLPWHAYSPPAPPSPWCALGSAAHALPSAASTVRLHSAVDTSPPSLLAALRDAAL